MQLLVFLNIAYLISPTAAVCYMFVPMVFLFRRGFHSADPRAGHETPTLNANSSGLKNINRKRPLVLLLNRELYI